MPWKPKSHEQRLSEAAKAELERRRPNARARGYDKRWRKARRVFLARHPRCAICGAPATTVDHIRPHGGDRGLFWDVQNWQALCRWCHARKTAGECFVIRRLPARPLRNNED